MVNWKNIFPKDLEYADRAFNHGIRKEEYEDIFRHPFYKEKFKYKDEIRYKIVGKSYGKFILAICTLTKRTLLSRSKLRIFSGREASNSEKRFYRNRFQ